MSDINAYLEHGTAKMLAINAYLEDGTTNMLPEEVSAIIKHANDSVSYPGEDYLRRQKAISDNSEYEGGSERPGPNNFWGGLGLKYIAVSLFCDTTMHNAFIGENFPEEARKEVMLVLACEVFKKLCPNSNEEDKAWFINNLSRVISSFN